MVRSLVSLPQAAAGSGNVPPAGSQLSVQCLAAEPDPPLCTIVSDTFAAEVVAADELPLARAPLRGAAVLPQAAAASPHAAISAPRVRIRVVPCLSSDVMPI